MFCKITFLAVIQRHKSGTEGEAGRILNWWPLILGVHHETVVIAEILCAAGFTGCEANQIPRINFGNERNTITHHFCFNDAVIVMILLGLHTKATWQGLVKFVYWLKIPIWATTNVDGDASTFRFLAVLLKISSCFSLRNVEMQSWTVVTGPAALSPVTRPPSPPHARVMWHILWHATNDTYKC